MVQECQNYFSPQSRPVIAKAYRFFGVFPVAKTLFYVKDPLAEKLATALWEQEPSRHCPGRSNLCLPPSVSPCSASGILNRVALHVLTGAPLPTPRTPGQAPTECPGVWVCLETSPDPGPCPLPTDVADCIDCRVSMQLATSRCGRDGVAMWS